MFGIATSIIFLIGMFFLQPSAMAEIPIALSPLVPLLLLIFQTLFLTLLFTPLQRAEYEITPRIFELLKNDSHFKWANILLFSLSLIVLFFSLSPLSATISPFWTMSFLILAFGIITDLFYHMIRRIYSYLDPFTAIKHFTLSAKKSLANHQEEKLSDWMESLSEIALKSIDKGNFSLSSTAVNESSHIINAFLESAQKRQALPDAKGVPPARISEEETNYLLIFFLDRLESVYNKAFVKKDASMCSQMMTLLGKTAIKAAQTNPSYATYPIYLIGKFSRQAEENGLTDLSLKGSCTLVELSKSIVENFSPPPQEFKDPFLSVIAQLDEIAKAAFKRDKTLNINFLSYPLQDIKNIFQAEKMTSYQDTQLLLKELSSVLAEWDALEGVMKMMPPLKQEKSELEKK